MSIDDFDTLGEYIDHRVEWRKRWARRVFAGVGVLIFLILLIISIAIGDLLVAAILMGVSALMSTIYSLFSLALSEGWLDKPLRNQTTMEATHLHALEQIFRDRAAKRKLTDDDPLSDNDMPFVTLSEDGELRPLIDDDDKSRRAQRR